MAEQAQHFRVAHTDGKGRVKRQVLRMMNFPSVEDPADIEDKAREIFETQRPDLTLTFIEHVNADQPPKVGGQPDVTVRPATVTPISRGTVRDATSGMT